MKRYTNIGIVAVLAAGWGLSLQAQAQQDIYVGLDISEFDYKSSGVSSARPSAIGFVLGQQINPNLAMEARVGTGLSDDRLRIGSANGRLDIDNYAGAYARGIWPAGPAFSLYGMVGFTHARVRARAGSFSDTSSEIDFSFGAGVTADIGNNFSLNAELARLIDSSSYSVNGLSVGVRYQF